ncbi:DNA repair ATPase [Streptomyces sp. JJ36]|uniref:DNA repair ATPase n=1 Tax=Streptomyces sp. JJ36 TaxID=2736645 RepID=UPI001F455413|nr:DNA repair ATPase [Streptomyces sp. JJ36]MCF6523762.1 DNA repair ATPase [Streptomyces sp. JJ36]
MVTDGYEVLRTRLTGAARELARRAEALNTRRTETFGGTRLELSGTHRLRTPRECRPCDLAQVGGLLLAGHTGAPEVRDVSDVLTLHRRTAEGGLEPAAPDAVPGLLDDPRFRQDFAELHRYYREARLLRLRRTGALLLAVFGTGTGASGGDLRVLRWRLAPDPDGAPEYLDARGERDHLPPPAHDVEWTLAGREAQVPGRHPHLAVAEGVFVSTEGGALTVKDADDTGTPEGVWSEPVDEPLQSLADAEVAYAVVGALVLLRVLPYKERHHRHLVVNRRTGEVVRLDAIGRGCRRLPGDQGVVFPGGCYLAAAPAGAAARTFEGAADAGELLFDAVLRSPNGEDVLHAFRAPATGRTLLQPYNLVRQEAAPPVAGQGWALFEDGALAVLRAAPDEEPGRLHPVQLWRTPFTGEAHAAGQPPADGPLGRIGNAELVACVSDCLAAARMAGELAPGTQVFEDVAAACARTADRYPWLDGDGLGALHEPLAALRAAAEEIVAEFAREEELRAHAAARVDAAGQEVAGLVRRARGETPDGADGWVRLLTGLRQAQGRVEALREIRHADPGRLTALGEELTEALAATGRRAVARLSRPGAFDATREAVDALAARAAAVATAADAEPLTGRIDEHAAGLRTVTEVLGGLETADTTVRTELLARVGEVTGAVNRARAALDARRRELLESEGRAEFEAGLALLGQSVGGALAGCGTPEECDDQLARLLVQVEDLTSRFGAVAERAELLAERRTEIEETFAARKQARLDERARHAERLAASADRVLATVARRSAALGTPEEVHAFFAADPLASRVRATAEELRELGDPVRAGELEGRLRAVRQEAARAQRDRADLYETPGVVRLGRHRFAVHTEAVALALVPGADGPQLAVTGTDYRAPVPPGALEGVADFLDAPLVSESPRTYRAEYLAAKVLPEALAAGLAPPPETAAGPDGTGGTEEDGASGPLLALVRRTAEAAPDEGYDRGVHDRDAARILGALLRLHADADLLRFTPQVRAAAQLFWAYGTDAPSRAAWSVRARSLARARAAFGDVAAVDELAAELAAAVAGFPPASTGGAAAGGPGDADAPQAPARAAGAYLFEELARADGPRFVTGAGARALLAGFHEALGGPGSTELKEYAEEMRALRQDLPGRRQLVSAWLGAYAAAHGAGRTELAEAVAIELCGDAVERRESAAPLEARVTGLLGTHPRVREGTLELRLDAFLARTEEFRTVRVPAHRRYTRRRTALLTAERERLGLDRFTPRPLPGFVRNRLIDEVYLPLIGDNLAKQLGTAGEERRTDSQGLLLLLSPPGYGKTTLLEYVAARLGLLFVVVNGPALGHRTTSLDPEAAPDAAARREVEKINLALELGSNVLLHLDDIQHTAPELLQKFIPLCDAQRRLDGAAGSHDLRGKRFAVSMAGNPFTESGARFRVPDMLANRADVWNLGEVLAGREELFAHSHVENALTAHPVLAPLASRDPADTALLVRLAAGDPAARADRLVHPYEPVELDRTLAVLRKLLRVRDTVLRVNAAYIASATCEEEARTEPPFLLQGSYRNTGKLAERLDPAMNDAEVEALVDDHYRAEAQTLAAGAEAALLKLAALRGRMTEEQRARWAELTAAYRRGR